VRIRTCATVLIVAYHAVLRRTVRCNQRMLGVSQSRGLFGREIIFEEFKPI